MTRCGTCNSSSVKRCHNCKMGFCERCACSGGGFPGTTRGSDNKCPSCGSSPNSRIGARAMRFLSSLVLLLAFAGWAWAQEEARSAVEAVLDDFHLAASEGDGLRYFGHFADGAVFHGTDITERWTKDEFQAYALPHFADGHGWTYVPQTRFTFVSDDGTTAWFDETLLNETFGLTRGTGVLVLTDDGWKVAQYHLTLPVPNDLIRDLVKMIETRE